MERLSHVDDQGRARMVDVGAKPPQRRIARAEGASGPVKTAACGAGSCGPLYQAALSAGLSWY